MGDPQHDEKMQLGKWIRSLGERANEARGRGDHRQALEVEMEIQRSWDKMTKLPASPAVQQAECNNIASINQTLALYSNDHAEMQKVIDDIGGEKPLEQTKILVDQANRLNDGTQFVVLMGHAPRYGQPKEIKPGDIRTVDVEDQGIADSVRRMITCGVDIEEALLQTGMIGELSDK